MKYFGWIWNRGQARGPAPTLVLSLSLLTTFSFAASNASIRAFNEGVKLFNQKQFREAIPSFDIAIENDSQFADAFFARGVCKYYLKSMDSALVDLNAALRLKPDYVQARALRGALLYETDRWDEALADFDAVLQATPDDAQSRLGRAVILLKREKWDGAERDFKAYLRLRPDDAMAPRVREVLASLAKRGAPAEEPEQEPSEPSAAARPRSAGSAPAARRADAGAPVMSGAELKRLADSFLSSNSMSDSVGQKVLRGEKAQATGDIRKARGMGE